jgi:hypothetical protein
MQTTGQVLAMRDIGVEESEELPQILHALVDDSPEAAIGRRAEQSRALIQAVREAAPALLQLQVTLVPGLSCRPYKLACQRFNAASEWELFKRGLVRICLAQPDSNLQHNDWRSLCSLLPLTSFK